MKHLPHRRHRHHYFPSLVLKRDGNVWACGMNNFGGPLDDNTTIDRTTAVQSLGLPPVVRIAAGTFHSLAT